jgi:alkylated DNA repair dioxygenase AlkB
MRPLGLTYRANFIDADEERELIARIETLTFNEVRMKGVVAKRMTIHYGWTYEYEDWVIKPADGPPSWLEPLIVRGAEAASIDRARIEQVMIARYPPNAAIGWHRDAPVFGTPVIGVSLATPCTMRFRRGKVRAWDTYALLLEPRSLYILDGAARSQWQHAIPKTEGLRYSVTMRTMSRSTSLEATSPA